MGYRQGTVHEVPEVQMGWRAGIKLGLVVRDVARLVDQALQL